jgi:hypothetical protein
MQRTILAAAILALVSMSMPRHATAQVSIDIEKPGLSLHAGPPVYGPPVAVVPPGVVYQPPVYYYPHYPKHYWKHWKHWDEHHWHHGHHGDGDWD